MRYRELKEQLRGVLLNGSAVGEAGPLQSTDRSQVEENLIQAILNILRNAAQAMRGEGIVQIVAPNEKIDSLRRRINLEREVPPEI